jgi:hypothetical protein
MEEHITSIFRWQVPPKHRLAFNGLHCLISQKTELFTFSLPLAFMLVFCSAYSSTLKMEMIFSSETSADFQWTTQCYIPEDSILHFPRHLLSHWYLAQLILQPWMWRRCSSEMSVDFQRTTWHYIPEDCTLHNNLCENLISYEGILDQCFLLCDQHRATSAVLNYFSLLVVLCCMSGELEAAGSDYDLYQGTILNSYERTAENYE